MSQLTKYFLMQAPVPHVLLTLNVPKPEKNVEHSRLMEPLKQPVTVSTKKCVDSLVNLKVPHGVFNVGILQQMVLLQLLQLQLIQLLILLLLKAWSQNKLYHGLTRKTLLYHQNSTGRTDGLPSMINANLLKLTRQQITDAFWTCNVILMSAVQITQTPITGDAWKRQLIILSKQLDQSHSHQPVQIYQAMAMILRKLSQKTPKMISPKVLFQMLLKHWIHSGIVKSLTKRPLLSMTKWTKKQRLLLMPYSQLKRPKTMQLPIHSRLPWDTPLMHVMIPAKLFSKVTSSNGKRQSTSYAKKMINKSHAQKLMNSELNKTKLVLLLLMETTIQQWLLNKEKLSTRDMLKNKPRMKLP